MSALQSTRSGAIDEWRPLLGGRLLTGAAAREHHSRDASHHDAVLPDAVAFPRNADEIARILRVASDHGVPVTPFGAGTGLEGGAIPIAGGLSLDLTHLDGIGDVSLDDMTVRVGAGVRRSALNAALRATGLFFSVDPGTDPSVGGMIATGASGTNAMRFGTIRENVLALEVVTADGRIVRTGTQAPKSSSGYDLTHLFVGSEGTLGIVTEATLRLRPIPFAASAHAGFPTLAGAVAAVAEIRRSGIEIGRVELFDAALAGLAARKGLAAFGAVPTLLFEFHEGGEGAVRDTPAGAAVVAILAEHGGGPLVWASGAQEERDLWEARRVILALARQERPGAVSWPTDVCVPLSRMAAVVEETQADIARSAIPAYVVGHVGDGNFHFCFMHLPDEKAEVARLADALVRRALEAGGTATGEHGTGLGKRRFLEAEHGAEAVALMRAIKSTLDPSGILNPGKILPAEHASVLASHPLAEKVSP